MINLGIDVNQKTRDDSYPLVKIAGCVDKYDMIKLLIDNNADVNIIVERENISLLEYLKKYNHDKSRLKLVEKYIEYPKDPGYDLD